MQIFWPALIGKWRWESGNFAYAVLGSHACVELALSGDTYISGKPNRRVWKTNVLPLMTVFVAADVHQSA
jgi:hypothetical protein